MTQTKMHNMKFRAQSSVHIGETGTSVRAATMCAIKMFNPPTLKLT